MPNTSDIRIRSVRPLISPAILEDELPLVDAGSAAVQRARREAKEAREKSGDFLGKGHDGRITLATYTIESDDSEG